MRPSWSRQALKRRLVKVDLFDNLTLTSKVTIGAPCQGLRFDTLPTLLGGVSTTDQAEPVI